DLRFAALAVPLQRAPKGLIGEDAREVVHAAIAFGLADDGDHFVRAELPAGDAGIEPGGVLPRLEFGLCTLERRAASAATYWCTYAAHIRPAPSVRNPPRGRSSAAAKHVARADRTAALPSPPRRDHSRRKARGGAARRHNHPAPPAATRGPRSHRAR